MPAIKQLMVAIDFHNMFFFFYGSQWLLSTIWLSTFFKISLVQQKIETHTGLEQHMGEYIPLAG